MSRAGALLAGALAFGSVQAAADVGPPLSPDRASALRLTLGVTGPLSEQYETFDIGGDYDIGGVRFLGSWLPDVGLHFGFTAHRVAMEPILAAKRKWAFDVGGMPLVPYVLLGLGGNLGFNRGSTDFGLAARGASGLSYFLTRRFGLTTELALELGPLVAPGAALQAAIRWDIGVELLW